MTRRLAGLTLDVLDDIGPPCRACVFWELDPVAKARAEESGDTAFEKEAWVCETLLGWGSCGLIVRVDELPAGYALFAPPGHLPRASAFPTAPVGADALLLATVRVLPDYAGEGLGRMLVQGVVAEAAQRGVKAIEAFGEESSGVEVPGIGAAPTGGRSAGGCVVPADFLRAVGFKTVRHHRRWPRLRLDVKSTASWRAEAEAAIERLIGGSVPTSAKAPVPAYRR